MQDYKFRIRNSILNDFHDMCGLAFQARWFGTEYEQSLFSLDHVQSIRWGSYFEQLVLGTGMGGKKVELNDKEIKSDLKTRIQEQAVIARKFIFETLKDQGFYFLQAQAQLHTEFVIEGITVPYECNIDAMLGNFNKLPTLNIDTKLTGDTTNTFGKYAWGKPETMNLDQLIGYKKACEKLYGYTPDSMYYIVDTTAHKRVEILYVNYSDATIDEYMWKLKETYLQINMGLNFGFTPKPSYNKCNNCPKKQYELNGVVHTCPSAILTPEIVTIFK